MLDELSIRDLGVIGEVSLTLAPGLNVVTGETGAGKTMVVSALELLLGVRADADQVRAGAEAAVVEGRMHPPPAGAADWLGEGDEELIVSREVSAGTSARSRARLSGRLAPASALAETVGAVVEIHGQSESVRLTAPAVQRDLLDRFGGSTLAAAKAAYTRAYEAWRATREELASLRTDDQARAQEVDRLRFELEEIDAVGPVPGEEHDLDAELSRLEHAESLSAAGRAAAAALSDDGAARDALGAAVTELRNVEGLDAQADSLRQRVEGVAAETQDLAFELAAYADGAELDPERLEQLRDRRGALAGLTRKYGPDAAAVATYADEARERLGRLEAGDERVAELEAEADRLEGEVHAGGQDLREARQAAGTELAATVERHLVDLAIPEARVTVAVEPTDPGPHGEDRVAFLFAANPDGTPQPLSKAASGGERSRLALAVRLALADADDTPVLVFDEVDAGIGGAVARAVGEKLARLARPAAGSARQVLCVTHLPQLAAYADAHFVVSKGERDGRTTAGVRRLDETERQTELARMLSGDAGSEAAARHAAELRAAARAVVEEAS